MAYGTTFYAYVWHERGHPDGRTGNAGGVTDEAQTAFELLQSKELAPLTQEDLRGLAKALEHAHSELGGDFYDPLMSRVRRALFS